MLKLTLPLLALVLCGCDTRAPESALFGTWHNTTPALDQATYYRFNSDHTFSISFDSIDDLSLLPIVGKWYAGGPNIYLRFTLKDIEARRPLVLHIVDISADEIRVRWSHDSPPVIWRRVTPSSTNASNQSLQPTASRRTTSFSHG